MYECTCYTIKNCIISKINLINTTIDDNHLNKHIKWMKILFMPLFFSLLDGLTVNV